MGWKRKHSRRQNLVSQVLQLWYPPNALVVIDDEAMILQRLQYFPTCTTCSAWETLQMIISSTHANARSTSLMARSTCRWKDAPGLRSPNPMRRYSKRPKGVAMAVLGTSAGFTGIWWYPFRRSIFVKTVQPAAFAAKSSMLGSGYTSGSVTRFSRRKSPQGRHPPSAFLTMCRGLDQGEVDR